MVLCPSPPHAGELKAPKILEWVKGLAKGGSSAGTGSVEAEAKQQEKREKGEGAAQTDAPRAEKERQAEGKGRTVPAEIPQVCGVAMGLSGRR